MRRVWQTRLLATLVLTGLFSCSTLAPQNRDYATYHPSAFNDLNTAPKGFAPESYSELKTGEGEKIYQGAKADYYFTLGDSYSLQGNSRKAIEAFKSVLIYDGESAMVYQRLSAEYIKQGMISEALSYSQQAVEKNPKFLEGRLLLGGLYSSLRMYDSAIEQYKEAMTIDKSNAEAPLYIGALLAERGDYDHAVNYFNGLLSNEGFENKYLAHYYTARVRIEQNTKESRKAAEAALHKAIELKPDFEEATMTLGNLYRLQAQGDKERDLYAKFQRKHGPSGRVGQELGKIYMEEEEYDKALEQFEVAEQTVTDPLSLKVKIALIYIEKKDYDKAIPKLHEVLELAPDSDKIRFYLAAVYEEKKDYNSAIAHYLKVPPGSPFYTEAIVHAAYSHKLLGELSDAIKLVKQSLEARSDEVQLYTLLASLLDEVGDSKNALKWLVKASEQFPENAQVHFYLGAQRDRLGQRQAMMKDMRRVIQLNPDHAQALNYLAFALAEQNESLDEAEKMARRALQHEPKDGYILDTVGWILLRRGDTVGAIRYLEAAFATVNTESIIAEHLGDAYFKSQLMEKAKKMYLHAIEVESSNEKRQQIRAKISAIDNQRDHQASAENRKPAAAEEGTSP